MDTRIRLREAILHAKRLGTKVKKRDLAGRLFPYTSVESAYVRFNNLERGETKTIDRITVDRICKELHVDANFLFSIKPISDGSITSITEGCQPGDLSTGKTGEGLSSETSKVL